MYVPFPHQILYLKCQSGIQGGGGVSGSVVTGGLVGRGVQQIMSRGAGAVQQLMGQRLEYVVESRMVSGTHLQYYTLLCT